MLAATTQQYINKHLWLLRWLQVEDSQALMACDSGNWRHDWLRDVRLLLPGLRVGLVCRFNSDRLLTSSLLLLLVLMKPTTMTPPCHPDGAAGAWLLITRSTAENSCFTGCFCTFKYPIYSVLGFMFQG